MGRVKRYKKFKACDPFAKRTKAEVDTVHDEPPELFEQRTKRTVKRGKSNDENMNEEDMYEMYLQREAKRAKKEEDAEKLKPKVNKIESKRVDESSKDFKNRIRQETRVVSLTKQTIL